MATRLGFPAITNPRDARATADAVSNIRQRIEAIESMLTTVSSTVTQSSSAGDVQFNTLRLLISQLTALVTQLESELLAADDAQIQLATRTFQPHTPVVPPQPVDAHEDQIATRVFMPHVLLEQKRAVSDTEAQLATQVFARRPPTLPDPTLAGDNAARILITQIFGA